MGQSRISWSVRAQLDVPMKLDVKKSQDIVITEKEETKEGNI